MAYSQGGLIAATDYNGFVGANPATGSGTINAVWGIGNGQYGYGQTAITQAAATAGLITATQWASLINAMNSISNHQSGTGTGFTVPTTGATVTYLSALSTDLGTYYTNALNATTNGTTTPGSTIAGTAITATNNTTYGPTTFATRTVTFASADQARYFFNAGGKLNFVITGVTNNDSTARSTDAVNTILTYFGGLSAFKATTNGGRTGTGGTVTTNNTAFGYYNLTTTPVTLVKMTTTSATYTGDYVTLNASTNAVNSGGHGDAGNVISFALAYYSAHTSTTSGLYGSTGDTLNVTASMRIDVVYPETTNLTNSWGTVVIA
jgi:hypothetical protein